VHLSASTWYKVRHRGRHLFSISPWLLARGRCHNGVGGKGGVEASLKDMRCGRCRIKAELGGACVRLVNVVALQQTKEILLVPCEGGSAVSPVNNKQQRAKREDENSARND
jgi:hypothetical protein